MSSITASDPGPSVNGWWAGLGRRRVGLVLLLATLVAAALNPIFVSSFLNLCLRVAAVALVLMLGFTLAGNWQQTLMPRWLLQTLTVALLAPLGAFFVATVAAGWNPAEVLRNEARRQRLRAGRGGRAVPRPGARARRAGARARRAGALASAAL